MEYTRPSRSDVHLSRDEAEMAEAAARRYFDGAAPKRHTKLQCGEYSSAYADAISSDDGVIPEHVHFQFPEKDNRRWCTVEAKLQRNLLKQNTTRISMVLTSSITQ
ncbi:maternal effect embryo arrest 59 [Striga asiatica]|uniref:Maternal effect embryo arrest 59 n=1 Tax=Striga asiatica TaxID=4170 RepID=A0A5A7RJF6_STRAF|nr:maternal effect embryo arrest 59 [Striga asiatica]